MTLCEPADPRKVVHTGVLGILLVLPWLAPWSPGPLPNVVPLLISWACIGLLMVVGQGVRPLDMARAWAIAAGASSVIGLLQYFGQAGALSPWVHAPPSLGEAMGNLRQRNQLATLTGIGIVAVLWWAQQGLRRASAWALLALLALGHAATNSRTGLLQMLLVAGMVLGWSRLAVPSQHRLCWRLALGTLGLYAVALWALPQLLSLGTGQDSLNALTRLGLDDGCGSRKVLWRNVLHLIGEKPWWGWGWGELKYAHYSTRYPGERFCEILGNAHNGPLHLAFVFGVPMAALILLGLLALTLALRPWRPRQAEHTLAWGVLAVIGLHSLLEFPLWYGPFQMAVLLCAVLLLGRAPSYLRGAQPLLWVTGCGILVAAALIAVDYARVRQIFIPENQRTRIWSGNAMDVAKSSLMFRTTADFAEFSLTPVTPKNAAHIRQTGLQMLHYSPEPKVIRKVVEAAQILGDCSTAVRHQELMKIAFPAEPIQRLTESRPANGAAMVTVQGCPP